MKFLIISDIHGSYYYAKKIPGIIEKEKPDKIILLGDLFHPSGTNMLPGEFNAMEVAKILNQYQEKILAVRGNCDSKMDEELCEFSINSSIWMEMNGLDIFFTHGNQYHRNHLPKHHVDLLIFGHLHTGFIEKEEGIIFANSGSFSAPREGTKNSYLILKENQIVLKDLEGNQLAGRNF